MTSTPLAALDLGSNTFRLLIAQGDHSGLISQTKKVWLRIPRISEGLRPNESFAPEPLRRARKVLEEFNGHIMENKVAKVLAGGTMAFRQASDGAEVLKEASRNYGWQTHVLSGAIEGRLSAIGVMTGLWPIPQEGLIFDIGGRSTEFINISFSSVVKTQSLPMGVVGLTEKYLHSDPPTPSELSSIAYEVTELLKSAHWDNVKNPTLIGTAGTVTTVAAMLMGLKDYDAQMVNNHVFQREQIQNLLDALKSKTISDRLAYPGLHPRRADVIIAGLVMVISILDFFNQSKATVSDNSLLEGLWLACAGFTSLEAHTPEVNP
jgi:exopolyphosphatase/guanosine-5'-triphosphate,3'-diphosphate pyrophosphatase